MDIFLVRFDPVGGYLALGGLEIQLAGAQSKTAISSALAGNHYLVPVRIDAHCQMSWFFRSIERRPQNFATRRGQSVARCEQVIHLEIESRPGTLTLSAAMNCEDAPGDHQFRHHFRLMGHFGTKDLTIKCDRS